MNTTSSLLMNTHLEDIQLVLRQSLGVDSSQPISPSTRFFSDLGLASIDAVVLGEALQTHYKQSLPFDLLMARIGQRVDRDLTIQELLDFLAENIQPAA